MKTKKFYTFSIVIPAYNEEKFLPECLESLKKQNFKKNFEIIVVDNNSTDRTFKIAKKFGVRVIKEKKRGVCFARQAGTKIAKGEIIISTDADNNFSPNWLANIYQAFNKNKKIVTVLGPYRFSDKPKWAKWYSIIQFKVVELVYKKTGKIIYSPASNFAFKKTAWQKIGGYDTGLTQGGDEYGLFKKLNKQGKAVYLPENRVYTSSRRAKKGIIYNLLVTLLLYYFLDYLIASKITGKTVFGSYPAYREKIGAKKNKLQLALDVSYYCIISIVFLFLVSSFIFAPGKARAKTNVGRKFISIDSKIDKNLHNVTHKDFYRHHLSHYLKKGFYKIDKF
jgi:glycosyltransferase involved in cell wall biosynthesis